MSTRPIPRCRATPTAVALRRWLCTWLAFLTALQMVGSTLAGLQGTGHRHRVSAPSTAPSTPRVHWRHGDVTSVAPADAHAQMHASGQAHDHAATDASVLPLGTDAATEAVAQLAAAVAPGADVTRSPHDPARHVRATTASWAATSRSIAPPLRPPRG